MAAFHGFVLMFLLFSNINVSVCDRVVEDPQDMLVNVGETATLSCEVESTRRPGSLYVYWYKSTNPNVGPGMTTISLRRVVYQSVDRYSIMGTGYIYDLNIINTELDDGAYYFCGLHFGGTSSYVYSRVARLDVFDQNFVPTCQTEPTDTRSLEVGSRVRFSCFPPSSSPTTPSLRMWKGGVIVPRVARTGVLSYTFELEKNDRNKKYTCTSTDSFPNIHNCTVIPLVHNTINVIPRKAVAALGNTAMFSCEPNGSPVFNQFKWVIGFGRKNVLRLTESSGRYIVSTNGESGRLTVTNIELSDNNTAIRCLATNSLDERLSVQATILITPSIDLPVPTKPSATSTITDPSSTKGDLYNSKIIPHAKSTSKAMLKEPTMTQLQAGGSSMERPQNGVGGIILAILMSLLVLLILITFIILYVRRKQGKPTPRFLKRLSVNRPLSLKKLTFSKPRFVERVSLSKGMSAAQGTLEVVQRRISTLKSSSTDAEKRSSIRDSQIEVVVNPPPPEWQFRNVEDVEKLHRNRLIDRHAPTGDYSHKEVDLLNALITGNIKMKTLDTMTAGDVVSGVTVDDDDADSQFESDFEEDEFDEMMSDIGNRAIDPTPTAPPRRKRVRKHKKDNKFDNKDEVTVGMEAMDTSRVHDQSESQTIVETEVAKTSTDNSTSEPLYCEVSRDTNDDEAPMYAIVNRKTNSTTGTS